MSYNETRTKAGYKHQIRYQQNIRQNTTTNKKWKRNIIRFHPSYSANAVTKVGKHFLSLLDKQFPPVNKFHKIFNRNTLKISYICFPNMKAMINSHNHKVTYPKTIIKDRTCNCVGKAKCPLSQNWLVNNIYKAVSTSTNPHYKKKSISTQLILCSSCDTQTIEDHLNFSSTKQTRNYPSKYGKWKISEKQRLSYGK